MENVGDRGPADMMLPLEVRFFFGLEAVEEVEDCEVVRIELPLEALFFLLKKPMADWLQRCSAGLINSLFGEINSAQARFELPN